MITLKFKKDKEGLKGRFKVLGQIALGIVVGATLYFHPGHGSSRDSVQIEKVEQKTSAFYAEEKSTIHYPHV